MTKERVFEIMGKYYGNAYYRSALRLGISEHDLQLSAQVLDKINALGYCFSNTHRLSETEDIRLVHIILDSFDKFENIGYQQDLLGAVHFRSYHQFVPLLLQIYENTKSAEIRNTVSGCLLRIRSRKYIPEYLRIINKPNYGMVEKDFILDLLCQLRVQEALPKLLMLLDINPHFWRWTFLKYVSYFKDPALLSYVEPFLEDENSEIKSLAKKAAKNITGHETAPYPESKS